MQSQTVCIIHNLSGTGRIIICYWMLFVTYQLVAETAGLHH